MIYSLFYRHNSSCTVFWVSSFHLSVNIVVLYQFTVPGHVYRKLRILSSSVRSLGRKKRFKIAIMFLGRRRRSREESPEWICASRCRQVSVPLIHVFAGFFALKPFYDYSLCSVCILPQVRSLQSAVCVLH